MECTIGWIKIKKGFILFKNRDTEKEHLKSNVFRKDNKLISIGYKGYTKRKGCWLGINKYGVGFASAKGSYKKIPKNYSSWMKFNEIGESVLKETKSLNEAKNMFIQLYKRDKIGDSANILLCDETKAYLLEFCLEKINIKTYSDFVFRTNYFNSLKEFNSDLKSQARLNKFKELFSKKIQVQGISGEHLIPLLTYHSQNKDECVCRHEDIMTVGSGIFELTDGKPIVYYNLNKTPCDGKFKKEII